MWELCKIYGKEPDDPWFENLDPIKKLWMYESWFADQEEKHEFARSYAIFTGSFTNMEMAQRLISQEDSAYKSTDEDFDESIRWVLEGRKNDYKQTRRRQIVDEDDITDG